VSQPPGLSGCGGPPDQQRPALVADVARFLSDWEQLLGQAGGFFPASLDGMQQRAFELQARARAVGFGGIGHHLEQLMRGLNAGLAPNAPGVRETLRVVSELAWQARQELSPPERAIAEQLLARAPAGSRAQPQVPAAAPQAPAPPLVASGPALPPMITVFPGLKGGAQSSASAASLGAGPVQTPPLIGAASQPPAAQPPAAPPPVVQPQPAVAPAAPAAPSPLNLAVRTMFGLRAFGRAGPAKPAEQAPQSMGPANPTGSSVLGLRNLSGPSAHTGSGRPPMIGENLPLPPIGGIDPGSVARHGPPAGGGEMRDALDRMRGSGRTNRSSRPKKVAKRSVPRRPGARQSSAAVWLVAVGVLGLGGLLVVGVLVWTRLHGSPDSAATSSSATLAAASARPAASESSGKSASIPREKLLAEGEQFKAMLAQLHGRGGKESPELRAYIEEQAALEARMLGDKCEGTAAECEAMAKARAANAPSGGENKTFTRHKESSDRARSRWLMGMKMPAKLPVEDDPRVARWFGYFTDNRVGREMMQGYLFRCGAYRDLIEATLIRYELPTSLMAVVFAESGCEPLAKSRVGAKGLWQFMPALARGYHLRVTEDVIDERNSPPKLTEAAVRFLADLYQKFGAWDLTFAAYNMGPYGLLIRLEKLGQQQNITFWDLADNDMLPDETADYVPKIEAIALILENLQRLKFSGVQMRAPEVTADLEVPPGTRLSLIARAAATSVNQIRTLNLDIIGDRVPNVPGERFAVQVPKDVVWQARDTLQELTARGAEEDQCMPPSFDWGKQRFTPEMERDCRRKLGGAAARAAAADPTSP
jgi:Transglycosylase SLT domain